MGIKIALAGNPNSGKTTLFNALTGSNQYVGNWPGVTVEKKEGAFIGDKDVIITDLPGIYSLSPYTMEEVVSRNYLVKERPDAILNIIDGTNIERNLYLTTQLVELGIPVVGAINMMDIVRKNGDIIDTQKLGKRLGCKFVEISALKETGIDEAINLAIEVAKAKEPVMLQHSFCGCVEHAIAHIEEATPLHDEIEEVQQRWYAIKIFERDQRVIEDLKLSEKAIKHIEKDIQMAEAEMDDDAESIITNERYNYITSVLKTCYTKKNSGKITVSDKIDNIVTNRFLAIPIFALIMFIVYYISVSTVGTWATDFMNDGVFGNESWSIPTLVGKLLTKVNCAEWLSSLILDGMIGGVGAVLGFVPQLLVLFMFLAFLESCGYMSRIAFMMDKIFRKFGLSGKSFIPMLIGTGCSVPGIMASRTVESESDRRMTIITTSFIPCGAKVPLIGLIAGALFGNSGWVATSAYFVGILAVLVSGCILKKTKGFSNEETPFVMELPAYHLPTPANVLRSMWERGWSFIKKAGTVILLSAVILWFLQGFGFTQGSFGMVDDLNNSILATIGKGLQWFFVPLGWGDWRAAVSTITGLIAKENVVSTFGVLFNFSGEISENGNEIWSQLATLFTPLSAYSFLMFNLLCAPCFAAMGAIKREMNSAKWTAFALLYQTGFAYAVSLCIYQIGSAIMGNLNVFGLVASILIIAFILYMFFRKNPNTKKAKEV